MAHITGHVRIAASVEQVFDTVADSRKEPSFNPAMAGVELLTPLPIGLGTRFRVRMGRAGTEMLVELTAFDRPHRLGSRTTSSMMETSGALTFAAEGEGTVMGWDWQVHPKGWMRMLGPLFGPLGDRMERRIWTELNTSSKPMDPLAPPDPVPTATPIGPHGRARRSRMHHRQKHVLRRWGDLSFPDVLGEKARTRCHESAAAAAW